MHLWPARSLAHSATCSLDAWPEPRKSEWNAAKKDDLEYVLYRMVCRDEISLKDAQEAMASNWIEAYKKNVPARKHKRSPALCKTAAPIAPHGLPQ
jgi:hypothetical protein